MPAWALHRYAGIVLALKIRSSKLLNVLLIVRPNTSKSVKNLECLKRNYEGKKQGVGSLSDCGGNEGGQLDQVLLKVLEIAPNMNSCEWPICKFWHFLLFSSRNYYARLRALLYKMKSERRAIRSSKCLSVLLPAIRMKHEHNCQSAQFYNFYNSLWKLLTGEQLYTPGEWPI